MIEEMRGLRNIGYFLATVGVILFGAGASSVAAETVSSPSYRIDGNFGGSFGGQTTSTNYKMSAIGGEAIVGNGASGSYMIDQQQTSTATPNMQLTVQPSGLVGFYPMDEGTGTSTADASRYQNNGTLKSTATWITPGKIGAAVDINGPPDHSGSGTVSIPDNANLPSGSKLTFETWVNADDPMSGNNKPIVSHWNGGVSQSWNVTVGYGRIWVTIAKDQKDTSAMAATVDTFTTANVWRHVVVVYDGEMDQANRVKIYVDGSSVALALNESMPSSLQNANASLSLGAYNGQYSAFSGSLDHAKLFDRALTASEVKAEYDAQNAGISTGFGLDATPGGSSTLDLDAIVRTNRNYSIAVQQDGDLQSGANSIPAVASSVASPAAWNTGTTKGFGFTLTGAPNLNGKWADGVNYAAIPSSATTVYDGTGSAFNSVDVVSLRMRLDTPASQPLGVYGNTMTYTGTMIP